MAKVSYNTFLAFAQVIHVFKKVSLPDFPIQLVK